MARECQMLVVIIVPVEVVADTPRSGEIAARLAVDVDQVAPHVMTLR